MDDRWSEVREHMTTAVEVFGRANGADHEAEVRVALRKLEDCGLMNALVVRLADAGLLLPTGGIASVERGQYLADENRIGIVGRRHTGWAPSGRVPHSHVRKVVVWPDERYANSEWPQYLGPWEVVDDHS